ncbi:MAG: alpha/beta hydrolase [Candidatus Helarchaeota archaeon]|nr:alpha/beta hydrolase [Candidatus Helarchaeota archaeon]
MVLEKDIELKRDDITLSGMLFVPERDDKNPAVIIAHGLPSTPLPVQEKGYDELGRKICALGAVSIIFNFSGCQGSGGYFSLKNWVNDLDLVSNYIWNLEVVDPIKVAFLAFSMGTIPTIYYVAHQAQNGEKQTKFLIICACPATLSDKRLAELRLGIHLTKDAGGIRIEKEYDKEIISDFKEHLPINWIDHISSPKFILHGARDDLVNVKNAHALYEKAQEPKELMILEKAGHKLRQDEIAMARILELIKKSM